MDEELRLGPSSPFCTGPADGRAELRPLRVAFLGRVSTDDLQDPTISIPRQVRNCRKVLPAYAAIVAQFYDVETGRAELARRGASTSHERMHIPVRRDGSIQDMLEEADGADRRFDAVICESVERIARRTYYGVMIEHVLERAGVVLMAGDEPASLSPDGRGGLSQGTGQRATGVLTRRMKQVIAEWYVLDMLEKSRAGLEEHTYQGFNVGRVPYGYQALRVEHPVPARRAEGKAKTRLAADPVRSVAVAQIFAWRVGERLSYASIAGRLNMDPDRFPAPVPTRVDRAVGYWTKGAVRDVLGNPKYTGHMVWNRRATRSGGRVNAVEAWVCSRTRTHEPIITVEVFLLAQQVGRWRRGSRDSHGQNLGHPNGAGHHYALRGHVFCALCGRRMFGKTRAGYKTPAGYTYMACERGPHPPCTEHPKTIWIQEAALLDGLRQFLAVHLLGPDRDALLDASVARDTAAVHLSRAQASMDIQRQISDLAARQRRLLHTLEVLDDPDPDALETVHLRLAELRGKQHRAEQAHRQLLRQAKTDPNAGLIDYLPIGDLDLDASGPAFRQLLELCRMEIHYDHGARMVEYWATLVGATIGALCNYLDTHLAVDHIRPPRPLAAAEAGILPIRGAFSLSTNRAFPVWESAPIASQV
jgi:site-specific DNA recombinase